MAEVQKPQQAMRFSDEELSLIKNTFAEDDVLLKVLRKVFFQGDLSDDELKIVRSFNSGDQSLRLLRKALLPEVDYSAPIFQITDLYVNIDTKENGVDRAYPLILARDLVHDYLSQQFAILEDKKPKVKIVFADLHRAGDKEPTEAFVQLSARNTLISHIEFQLYQLKLLAGKKDESVEDTKRRLAANSNK